MQATDQFRKSPVDLVEIAALESSAPGETLLAKRLPTFKPVPKQGMPLSRFRCCLPSHLDVSHRRSKRSHGDHGLTPPDGRPRAPAQSRRGNYMRCRSCPPKFACVCQDAVFFDGRTKLTSQASSRVVFRRIHVRCYHQHGRGKALRRMSFGRRNSDSDILQ